MIEMEYQTGGALSLKRTLNFYPESHAFFKVSCLGDECRDGHLNLTRPVTTMIKNHRTTASGSLSCTNRDPAAQHADMSYRVSIEYL